MQGYATRKVQNQGSAAGARLPGLRDGESSSECGGGGERAGGVTVQCSRDGALSGNGRRQDDLPGRPKVVAVEALARLPENEAACTEY